MEAIRLLRYKGWSNVGDWKSIKINGIAKIEKLVADESYHRNTEGGQYLTHKQFSEISMPTVKNLRKGSFNI